MHSELLNQIYDDVDEIVIYKNSSMEILYCNKFTLRFLGYKSREEIIGKTDYDLSWSEYADLYSSHEKISLEGDSYPIMLPVSDSYNNLHLSLCRRTLFVDNGRKFTLTQIHLLKNTSNMELSNLISCYSEHHQKDFEKILSIMTRREEECLFYLLRCRSTKAIGIILGISHRTVETHIAGLRSKFNCAYKSDLTDKAIAMGFLFYMPKTLMDSNMMLLPRSG